jgi:hypothetical protein
MKLLGALLRWWIVGRRPASSGGIRGSDHERELVEGSGEGQSRTCIGPEFVVPSP